MRLPKAFYTVMDKDEISDLAVYLLMVALACLGLSHYFGVPYIFGLIVLCITSLLGYVVTDGFPIRRGKHKDSDHSDSQSVGFLLVPAGIAFALLGLVIAFPQLSTFGAD